MSSVSEALALFGPTALTWRLLEAVLGALPGTPELVHQASVAGEADEELVWMGRLIDATDQDRPFRFDGEHDLEVQADDAVLKALAIGWLAWRTGAGSATDRAETFRSRPAGRVLIAWWAAIDVALPLGGCEVAELLDQRGNAQLSRLAALAGEHSVEGAMPAARALAPTLQRVIELAAGRSAAIAAAAAPFVPGLLARADGADQAVGARADRMPVYKLLTARLAAEHAAG